MKRCPICGAHAVEEAGTCFECLYHFDTLSTEDVCKLEAAASPPIIAAPEPAASPIFVAEPSAARSFSIDVRFGAAPPHRAATDTGSLYVGRGSFNDVVIDDECVMRRHAHLYRLEQGIFMELLTPEAAATVNGQSTRHISLICDEDVIGFGACDAIVHC